MYALVVRFELRPDTAAEFDRLVGETLEGIRRSEPGTLLYLCHSVEDDPDVRIFYELYADRAAFEGHEQQPHVRRFLKERDALLTTAPRVEFLESGLGKSWPQAIG